MTGRGWRRAGLALGLLSGCASPGGAAPKQAPYVVPPAAGELSPAEQKREEWRRSRVRVYMDDFGELGRYRAANAALPPAAPGAERVVFYGDSITDLWPLAASFPGKPYVNRGISGQTTPQMLVRFRQDVIALSPKVVVILAGTNDIAGNTGPIAALNAWLKTYAAQSGCVYLDYARAMTDGRGLLQRDLADDGLHPNKAGYAVMAPLAEAAIAAALASPSSPQTSVCYK